MARFGVVAIFAVVVAWAASLKAGATDRLATPETFANVWSQAQGGDRILLASGDYGEFKGGSKSSTVTIMPQPGASASMSLGFYGASNIRVEGLTITSLSFTGPTHDVTVAHSTFAGQAVIRADEMNNANVVLDGNSHPNINVGGCGDCYEGRIQVTGGSRPSGVTVKNSVIGPGGDADGMQIGADGVQVLNNEFVGIKQIDQVHTDSLQLYGSSNTVIRGNYFHDFDVAIMAPDNGDHEQITDNAFIANSGGYPQPIQLGSHVGTVFAHNVAKNMQVHIHAKDGNPPGRDNIIRDNVLINAEFVAPADRCVGCTTSHNLFTKSSQASGSDSVVGNPVFAGGANPTTWAGWALGPGSPGTGSASDGGDRGIRLSAGPPETVGAPGAAAPAPKANGLVAAYGFNEARGTRLADSSGGGHDARLNGARHTRTARAGMALAFSGRSTVLIPRSATSGLTKTFTLEAWARSTARRDTWREVFGATGHSSSSLRKRRWSHVAVTYGASRLRVYVNGRLASSRRTKSPLKSGAIVIGRSFKGQIDDLRVYRRPLSRAELRADMANPR